MKQLQNVIYQLLLLTSVVIITSSCTEQGQISDHKVFRYNEIEIISSLDPAFATFLPNHWVVNQIFNSPLEFNNELEIQPSLAKKWEILDSGKTYKLTMRNDVFFHDHELFEDGKGRKMTAYDLQYTLRRVCDTTSIYNKGIWVFKDKVLKTNQGLISDTCFLAKNDTTILLYLEKPVPNFLQILCMPFCFVVPHEVADSLGKSFGQNPVGTGPFCFDSWDHGNKLIFKKNDGYWKKDKKGRQLPYLDAVEVSFISDDNQSFRAFQLGDFDFITRMNEYVLDEVLYSDGTVRESIKNEFNVLKGPYLATDYLAFQTDPKAKIYENDPNSPFLNLDFRKALNYSVDRKRIVTLLRNGLGIEGENGIIPPAMPYFNSTNVKGYSFDPQKAQEHLRASGFKPEELKGLKINVAKQFKDLSQFLVKTWKENLGIDIAIELQEGKVLIDASQHGTINFLKLGWLADYPDGENYLTLFYGPNFSPGGPNRTHYKSPEFDSLFDHALTVNDPYERGEIYEKMDSLMMTESPIISIYYGQILALTAKNVKNFHLNPMNSLVLEEVDLED